MAIGGGVALRCPVRRVRLTWRARTIASHVFFLVLDRVL
jgi:hypothetical protein